MKADTLTSDSLFGLVDSIPKIEILFPIADLILSGVTRAIYKKGSCVAVGGIFVSWHGVGEMWVLANHKTFDCPIFARKVSLDVIHEAKNKFDLHRVQADADFTLPYHSRWLESLGFNLEGVMRQYTQTRGDMARYAIIFKENK